MNPPAAAWGSAYTVCDICEAPAIVAHAPTHNTPGSGATGRVFICVLCLEDARLTLEQAIEEAERQPETEPEEERQKDK